MPYPKRQEIYDAGTPEEQALWQPFLSPPVKKGKKK
jgi:hypothetical protein